MKTKFTKVAVPNDYPGKIYQELHNHMCEEHGLILLESQMQDIIHIVNKMQSPDREDEMREMLEKVEVRLNEFHNDLAKSVIDMEVYNPLSSDLLEIKSLLQSLKQKK